MKIKRTQSCSHMPVDVHLLLFKLSFIT